MAISTMIVLGIAGWILVLVVSYLIARLARAKDVLRVVVWSFVGLNVVVYLPAAFLVQPRTVVVKQTAERISAQVSRRSRNLDRLEQELAAAKAVPGADLARFALTDSAIGRARSALAAVSREKGTKQAYEQLKKANKLAAEARHEFDKATKAGTGRP